MLMIRALWSVAQVMPAATLETVPEFVSMTLTGITEQLQQ
jgi:hypothetical protein